MSTWHIRPATPDDAAACIAHLKRLADEPNNGTPFTSAADVTRTPAEEAERLRGFAENNNGAQFVVESAGQVVGVGTLVCGRRIFHVYAQLGISIDQPWRGKGIGRALMNTLIAWARQHQHIKRLELRVFTDNTRAIRLYQSLGFTIDVTCTRTAYKAGRFVDEHIMSILFDDKEPTP